MPRKLHHIRSVADYNAIVGAETLHPLVSVVCYDELPAMRDSVNRYDVYGIFLRDDRQSRLVSGLSVVDTAYSLGFNYPHHFTRAFKQRFGMLPSDYQKGAKYSSVIP